MRPVVTPSEMAAIDAEAPEPIDELIARAGWATARAALDLLDRPAYGARIAVLAGKGNNGADGRFAIPHLRRAGAHCTLFELGPDDGDPGWGSELGSDSDPGSDRAGRPEPFDLIIDACYGTGLQRHFDATALPLDLADTPVLSVDIPSGVDGLTGQHLGTPISASATVTFAAPKPGLLLWPGRANVGRLTIADIGLDCSRATIHQLEPEDLDRWPKPTGDTHKWRRAVLVVGGGPGMTGAPGLAARAAMRAGAGYAALAVPGSGVPEPAGPGSPDPGTRAAPLAGAPIEAVGYPTGADWAGDLLARTDRFGAVVVGPGLAETPANAAAVNQWWSQVDRPTVFDAGALSALAVALTPTPTSSPTSSSTASGSGPADRSRPRRLHVLTPHEGEFARLARLAGPGAEAVAAGGDRIGAVRVLAADLGAVILLKGPTTVVADPDGRVLLATAGDARLATAGTGDVLAGIIGAGLAAGLEPLLAAGLGAELHGRAASRGLPVGLVASDLPDLVAGLLSDRWLDPGN